MKPTVFLFQDIAPRSKKEAANVCWDLILYLDYGNAEARD